MALHKSVHKSGQVEITFNWIYVLIAGVVILLFFIGIVFKQKAASEEKLAGDVVRILESVFTAGGVSEKTKNFIDTSGLADYTLYFRCQEGAGEFGIVNNPARIENTINPVFAPSELQTKKLIIWSLPYSLPYKVTDFLFITSINTKYLVLGDGNGFADEFMDATEGFTRERVTFTDLQNINPGAIYHLRIIDLEGVISSLTPIPENLARARTLTAVSFRGDTVYYYQKNTDNEWEELNSNSLVSIISLGGERDAAKYAAIFAADAESYQCNMQKAFRRLRYVTEVYAEKLRELETHYTQQPLPAGECLAYINGFTNNLVRSVDLQMAYAKLCETTFASCSELLRSASDIKTINNEMLRQCIPLY